MHVRAMKRRERERGGGELAIKHQQEQFFPFLGRGLEGGEQMSITSKETVTIFTTTNTLCQDV